MRVLLASEPSAADRPNEDFAAVVPGAVVLLDGAGYEPESGIGCVHGIAWYARNLGGLLAAGACDDRVPLAELLTQGIERVSQMHVGTCDLGHPATPGSLASSTRISAIMPAIAVMAMPAGRPDPRRTQNGRRQTTYGRVQNGVPL